MLFARLLRTGRVSRGRVSRLTAHGPSFSLSRVKQRPFGNSGISVSELGLGTWQVGGRWGEPFDVANADRVLRRAVAGGINFIDLASKHMGPNLELVVAPGLTSNAASSGAVPESMLTKGKDKKVGISTRRFKQLALICGLGAMGILAACASSPEYGGGAGGSSAKGGSTGSGGSSARGGSTGSGGSSAAGGTLASGGATSSGGSSGSPVTLFDFATDDQGWVFNTYQATANGEMVSPYNLAAPGVLPDAGVAPPTIAADSTVGDPPGSLKIVVTFTGYTQQVNPNYHWATPQDWTNKVVSVRVKVDPAVPATFTGGGIQLFAQDSTWVGKYQWADFPTDSDWHTYTLDMTGVTSPDPTNIVQFTVQLASATTPSATDFTQTTVTAYIDTITIQ
jgi:hypothetical protein